MAQFSITNFAGIEANLAHRIAAIATANETVETDIAAQKSRLDAVDDDTGIAAALRAAEELQDKNLDIAEQIGVADVLVRLAGLFQSYDTTPRDTDGEVIGDSLDSWFTSQKSALTNPLLTNEFARAYRKVVGHTAALSAANCSAAAGTSYGTSTVTGETAVTNVLVDAPVDTDLYAGGLLEGEVTTQVEGKDNGNTVFTLTGVDINGSPWQGTCTIPDASTVGTKVEVVPSVPKTYPVELTGVTVANGGSGVVRWQVKTPRTLEA